VCDGTGEKLKGKKISVSVAARRTYGQEQKQKFYADVVGRKIETPFAWDFEDIGGAGRERGNVANKMAVIYVDGNGFGQMQSELCTNPDTQRKFDRELKQHRREFLKTFLEQHVLSDPDGPFVRRHDGARCYRMETLLWGGDEFMLVVPAWRGWEALQYFFGVAQGWTLLATRVTHAAGLVFCSYKAPIHRVAGIARQLCEHAKRERNRNLFAYQVLESFDVVPSEFDEYRQGLVPDQAIDALNIEGTEMPEISEQMSTLKENEFPRRKLFDLARGRLSHAEEKDFLAELPAEVRSAADALRGPLNGGARWYHIAELWDYVGKGGATPWL
jgi:hypothetical protein